MTTTAIDHTYRYGFASEYVSKIEGSDLGRLALAVDSSTLKTPTKKKEKFGTFFSGTLLKPKKICDLLRGVSESREFRLAVVPPLCSGRLAQAIVKRAVDAIHVCFSRESHA